jgi:hypothetical protein
VNGKSAGQTAYEAFMLTDPPDVPGDVEVVLANTWQAMGTKGRARWESVAAAVETEQLRLARADRDQLKKRMLGLVSEYGDATENDEVDGHVPGSLYMAIRAEVLNAAGAQIRKGLDV